MVSIGWLINYINRGNLKRINDILKEDHQHHHYTMFCTIRKYPQGKRRPKLKMLLMYATKI